MLLSSRLPLAVAAALSLVGAGLTWSVYKTETAGQQATFDVLTQRAARRIETRIEQHIALLSATRAFHESFRGPLDREVFALFVDWLELDGRYSGLQGIGVARVLTSETEPQVEAGLARDYGAEIQVWPEPVPGLRTAIILLEPANARNRATLGFDMATEERRRAAMLEALETGEAAATAPLQLVQEITEEVQTGLLIYLPLSRPTELDLEGFTYAAVRAGDLFTAALEGGDLPLEIHAHDAEFPELPLFESSDYVAAVADGGLSGQVDLRVAGREWILSAQAAPGLDEGKPLRNTALSALVFALLVASATYAVHWQDMANRRALALSEAVQRNVEQKDILLREMVHRLKNALTRISGIARQTAREATSKEEMVARFNARLQAMGAAQDLLMLSGTDTADLEELLRSETDQISGSVASPDYLSGPSVRLNERQTHALALVFHELATNALKYGAGAGTGGELRVTWSVESGTSGEELRLIWEERAPEVAPSPPGPGSGFGTRLLEAMIRGELGGSLTRRPHVGGLRIEMRFPLSEPVQVAVS
jgi:CHASE1-domain containing sensor protein